MQVVVYLVSRETLFFLLDRSHVYFPSSFAARIKMKNLGLSEDAGMISEFFGYLNVLGRSLAHLRRKPFVEDGFMNVLSSLRHFI